MKRQGASRQPNLTARLQRLAPSGPRPNALPLHNVRYRKAGERTAEDRLRPYRRPSGLPAPKRSFERPGETDELHRKDRRPSTVEFRPLQVRQVRRPSLPEWWSQTGSNRRPHACKARALPTELWPRRRTEDRHRTTDNACRLPSSVVPNLVGLGGLEPPTSRLSSARSNQLSYKPVIGGRRTDNGGQSNPVVRRLMSVV